MRKSFRLLLCCTVSIFAAGCTVQEPSINPDVGGFAVIDFTPKKAIAADRQVEKPTHVRS